MTLDLDTRSPGRFRDHARAWLTLAPPSEGGAHVIVAGGRRALAAESLYCRNGCRLDDILLIRGDFSAGSYCRLTKPVFVGGDCQIGKKCQVEALSVMGDLTLGPGAVVNTWAHAGGRLDLRPGCKVRQQALSERSIVLGADSAAAFLHAPEVASHGRLPLAGEPNAQEAIQILPPSSGILPHGRFMRGFFPEKLSALGADTWIYEGTLHLQRPILLRAKLVVRGSFVCPGGSLLEDDVKAGGSIRLGPGSISRGHLTARGDVLLERDCLFEGRISAGLSVRLSSGVRGFGSDPVEVAAVEKIHLEPNVVVRGTLAAEQWVQVVEPEILGGIDLLLAQA